MRVRRYRLRHVWPIIGWVSLGIGVAAALFAGVWFLTREPSPLPDSINNSLEFSPLVIPISADEYTTKNYELSRGEGGEQLLVYDVISGTTTITFSQYTQPAQFTEITDYQQHFLNNVIQQTSTVQTANGTIYLGQLSLQDSRQVGVMLDRGLILFMNPSAPLTDDEWRTLGETLTIQTVR